MLYFVPALILAIVNGILLRLTEQKVRNLTLKVGIGFIPLLILTLLAIGKESPIQFIATFGIIGIGITNLIWTIKLINKKPVANNV